MPLQISHDMTWDQTQVVAVGGQQQTSYLHDEAFYDKL
jgi:hypothetical protein